VSARARSCFALALALAAGCESAGPRVRFGGEVQPSPGVYKRTLDRWTRHMHATQDFDTAIDAWVTMLSPEFRSRYLATVEAMRQLSPDERAKLEATQRDEAAQFIDLIIVMQTSRWDWNDLTSPRSLWSLTLVDDRGRETAPVDQQYAPLKTDEAAALYRGVGPFSRVWRVRFPRTLGDGTVIGGPETRSLTLRMAGPLGATKAIWLADDRPVLP
jgi:hypothetical protein